MAKPVPCIDLKPTAVFLGPCLAAAGTIAIWMSDVMTSWITPEKTLLAGGVTSIVLWLLVLSAAGLRARRRTLRTAIAAVREMHLDPPTMAPTVRRPGITYLPGAFILVLATSATIAIWMNPAALAWLTIAIPATPLGIAGGTATGLIWCAAIASALGARRVKRLVEDYAGLVEREESARDAVEVIPVLISVCRVDGMRSQFNDWYLETTGKTEEELQGHGWLNCVHAEDRERLMTIEAQGRHESIELEYGIFAADGRNRWIRETLVPRVGENGRVQRFIATGIDITQQIEADAANTETIEKLRVTVDELKVEHDEAIARLDAAHARELEALSSERSAELERLGSRHEAALTTMKEQHCQEIEASTTAHRTEASEMRRRLASATRSKERLEAKLQEATDSARRLTEESGDLRRDAAEARAELQAALADRGHAQMEIRKLQESVEKLQALVNKLEQEEAELRGERERTRKLVEGARTEASDVHRSQSQLRGRISRLTDRVQGLEDELSTVKTAHDEALEQLAASEAASADAIAEGHRALAGELHPQLQAVIDIAQRLHDGALDESQLSALEGAQASAAAMTRLVESALGSGEDDPPSDSEAPAAERAFDLRDAVQSVCTLLEPAASAHRVALRCSVHPEFPGRVVGNPVAFREVLIHGVRAALDAVEDVTLHVGLASNGTTESHVAARVELRVETGRFEEANLRAQFGLDAGDAVRTPGTTAVSAAWHIVRRMRGSHGLELPREGGFVLWFAATLPRQRDAAAAQASIVPDPGAAAHPASPRFGAGMLPPGGQATVVAERVQESPLAPRMPQEDLVSDLGPVLELGCDSARIRCGAAPAAPIVVRLEGEAETLALPAVLVSCEPHGRAQDVVVRFATADAPDLRRQLLSIAMAHRHESSFGGRAS